jgi:hypothetical protein
MLSHALLHHPSPQTGKAGTVPGRAGDPWMEPSLSCERNFALYCWLACDGLGPREIQEARYM